MLLQQFRHRTAGSWLFVPLIAGLLLTGVPAPPARAQVGLDPSAVRNHARLLGLESLRTAMRRDIGQPLVLNPELGRRNVPLPPNLSSLLNTRTPDARRLAAQVGKALFWDQAVGSDGMACASCHFAAGADGARVKNQLSPNFTRRVNERNGNIVGFFTAGGDPDYLFQLMDPLDDNPAMPNKGPNYTLKKEDFPFIKDIGDGDNVILVGSRVFPHVAAGNTNDVASSQGNFLTTFRNVVGDGPANPYNPNVFGLPGIRDNGDPYNDVPHANPAVGVGFQVSASGGAFDGRVNVRRVEPRNTPTVINAVFNLHNFWDGRANFIFNGVNPFGNTDPEARIFTRGNNRRSIATRTLALTNASLASQAVGPPLSPFEMSFTAPGHPERNFFQIGRKMLKRKPLQGQAVAADDSLLAGFDRNKTYADYIRLIFAPNLWDSTALIAFPLDTVSLTQGFISGQTSSQLTILEEQAAETALRRGTLRPSQLFTQMEANFPLFFGILIMLYEAELVSDATPFDKFMEGDNNALSPSALLGLAVFTGFPGVTDGRCINCHGGPEFTNASIRHTQAGQKLIEGMLMADGQPAFYDAGFYNVGVTPTPEDIGRGGANSIGRPLASSRQSLFQDNGLAPAIDFPILGLPIRDVVPQTPGSNILIGRESGLPICEDLNGNGLCDVNDNLLIQRVAVDGAFKTPGLRNVELTGPYLHNGSLKTLKEVVQFYDRGGNFCRFNFPDLDPDITFLGLTEAEEEGLVAFTLALTDERVRKRQAPFDNPELRLPHGHPGDENNTTADALFQFKQAQDAVMVFEAVGRNGAPPSGWLKGFQTLLGLEDGLEGHLFVGATGADEVASNDTVNGAPRCNLPVPPL